MIALAISSIRMLLQVASIRSGVTGRFLRATRPTAGPTPVEAPASAVTRSGPNRSDAGPRFLEGNRSDTGRRPKRNGSDAGGRSLERTAPTRGDAPSRGTGRTQAEASSRRDRSDAGRGFLKGEPVRCSSTVPHGERSNAGRRSLKRRTGRARREAFSKGLVGRRLRHPQGNRADAGRRVLPSVVSRCGVGETAGWPQGVRRHRQVARVLPQALRQAPAHAVQVPVQRARRQGGGPQGTAGTPAAVRNARRRGFASVAARAVGG